jgi:hypothetical protein
MRKSKIQDIVAAHVGLICLVLFHILGCETNAFGEEQKAVRQHFAQLKEALESGNGKLSSELVTAETLAMYEKCRMYALDSSTVDFEELLQLEVLLIFQLRYLLERSALEVMSGQDIFVWGVENGLIKKDTLKQLEINTVQIEGEKAFATLLKDKTAVDDAIFLFYSQAGKWKLDFANILSQTEAFFDNLRSETGRSKIDIAVYLLEKTYEEKIPVNILDGPLQ